MNYYPQSSNFTKVQSKTLKAKGKSKKAKIKLSKIFPSINKLNRWVKRKFAFYLLPFALFTFRFHQCGDVKNVVKAGEKSESDDD